MCGRSRLGAEDWGLGRSEREAADETIRASTMKSRQSECFDRRVELARRLLLHTRYYMCFGRWETGGKPAVVKVNAGRVLWVILRGSRPARRCRAQASCPGVCVPQCLGAGARWPSRRSMTPPRASRHARR